MVMNCLSISVRIYEVYEVLSFGDKVVRRQLVMFHHRIAVPVALMSSLKRDCKEVHHMMQH